VGLRLIDRWVVLDLIIVRTGLVFVLLMLCLWVLEICWHSFASGTRFVDFHLVFIQD
jgi:hypothetical protein